MNVLCPRDLDEALALRQAHPDHRILLGGTDLVTQWNAGVPKPPGILVLDGLGELRFIQERDGVIVIGAGTTHQDLLSAPVITQKFPALGEAALTVGAPAIRIMGTVGGNLANASPAADLPPAFLAYEARVVAASRTGRREIPLALFYTGYRQIDLRPDEILLEVQVPVPAEKSRSAYYKAGTRAAQSIARVALSAYLENGGDGTVKKTRLAAASVAPVPVRLRVVEDFLQGRLLDAAVIEEAGHLASTSVQPIDDVRSTARYRAWVLGSLVKKFLSAS